jgi:hypothetical protein
MELSARGKQRTRRSASVILLPPPCARGRNAAVASPDRCCRVDLFPTPDDMRVAARDGAGPGRVCGAVPAGDVGSGEVDVTAQGVFRCDEWDTSEPVRREREAAELHLRLATRLYYRYREQAQWTTQVGVEPCNCYTYLQLYRDKLQETARE